MDSRNFNLLDETVISWAKKHNPDSLETITKMIEQVMKGVPGAQSFYRFVVIAFQAGRQFQLENPNVELSRNVGVYNKKLSGPKSN